VLYSIIIELNTDNDILISASNGEIMNGVFYNLLNTFDAESFEILHSENSYKPFTISPLSGNIKRVENGNKILLNSKYPIWFRITFISNRLFIKFAEALKDNKIKNITIINKTYPIKDIYFTKDKHLLASFSTIEELLKNKYNSTYIIKFITPTSFAIDNKIYPFPDNEIFFKSLIKKWNFFTNLFIDNNIRDEIIKNIKIGKFKIESKMYTFAKYLRIGFIGEIEYKIVSRNKILKKWFNALCLFSFYSGVGIKTTMGMGQVSVRGIY